MATKQDLSFWTIDALQVLGGSAHHVRVAEHIWTNHEEELRSSGDLEFTWQYDLRWAAQRLRNQGKLKPITNRGDGIWELSAQRVS